MAIAFDAWYQERRLELQRLTEQTEQVFMGLESQLHSHGFNGTLTNIGFTGITWQQHELTRRLLRMGKEAQSPVIWGKRQVLLSSCVREHLYKKFLDHFRMELTTEAKAPLPLVIPGMEGLNTMTHCLLPRVLFLLAPPSAANSNIPAETEIFPALGLIYQAYHKSPLLEKIIQESDELKFYLDKAWVNNFAMLWQDIRLSNELARKHSEQQIAEATRSRQLARMKAEELQREDLLAKTEAATSSVAEAESVQAGNSEIGNSKDKESV